MADVTFDVNQLKQMKRPRLQQLCKKFGIKANSKTSQLINDLKEYRKTILAQQSDKPKTLVSTLEVKEVSVESQAEKRDTPKKDEDDDFKKEMIEHLENTVKETLNESKIPRLNTRVGTFTVTTQKTATPKEHVAFRKYRAGWLYDPAGPDRFSHPTHVNLSGPPVTSMTFSNGLIRALEQVSTGHMVTATTARSIVADMKASHNTPARKTPQRKKVKTQDKSVTIETKPFVFGHLRSPKVSGFSFGSHKPQTPAARKSFCVGIKAKENRTPCESRKSIAAVTPSRFQSGNLTADSTTNPTSAKKKFDLQASLSKPLPYKPHGGKLAEFKFSSAVESKIPVRTNNVSLCKQKKVDVKNVKITSRAERRGNEKNKRANRRKNAMCQRRGLV